MGDCAGAESHLGNVARETLPPAATGQDCSRGGSRCPEAGSSTRVEMPPILGRHQGGDTITPGCNKDISSHTADSSILHISLQRLPPPQLHHPQPPHPPKKNQTQALLSSSLHKNWVKLGGPPPRGHVPPIAEPFPGVRAPVDKT